MYRLRGKAPDTINDIRNTEMTTETMMDLTGRVIELSSNGLNVTKIRATLTLEDYSSKDISAAIKEADITSTRSGFAASFYAFLSEAPRTKTEAEYFVMNETSDNTKKHKSHFMAIYELADKIWEAK